VLAVLNVAPLLTETSPENVLVPALFPSVKLPAVTVVFPEQVKLAAPKASEPATLVFPLTEIAPVAVPTLMVPFTDRFPETVSVLLPDMVNVFEALTVRLIAEALALVVTGPSITTELAADGTTPPIQVPAAFQFPPAVLLVIVWADNPERRNRQHTISSDLTPENFFLLFEYVIEVMVLIMQLELFE
jgi:hypothetical protein